MSVSICTPSAEAGPRKAKRRPTGDGRSAEARSCPFHPRGLPCSAVFSRLLVGGRRRRRGGTRVERRRVLQGGAQTLALLCGRDRHAHMVGSTDGLYKFAADTDRLP